MPQELHVDHFAQNPPSWTLDYSFFMIYSTKKPKAIFQNFTKNFFGLNTHNYV